MKYLTVALFLGAVSTYDITNMLKISVDEDGQERIADEAEDVANTWDHIKHSKPVRNLGGALKRWGHSKEVAHIKALDKKFLASPMGKKLVKEWKDVGEALEDNVYHNKKGIHITDEGLDEIADELEDVGETYEKLGKTRWAKAYHHAYKSAFHNKQFGGVKRAGKAFKYSKQGKWLRKEMHDLKVALKQEVKVTDIPEDWKKKTDLLKIEVSRRGQKAIEKEANDVHDVAEAIKDSRVVRNLGKSLERWGESEEVDHLKALDKKFLASPEGKRLVAEWKDFGHALKKHVKETPNGIHVENSGMDEISDELDDVADQYKKLEHSKWARAYDKGWDAATHNKEARSVGRRFDKFEHSEEAHALGKELHELDQALKENVKVSDVPEDWKAEQNLLHIKIHNQDDIEDEWDDVEETWDNIKDSRPVRNLGQSLEDWGTSQEIKDLKALDKKFLKSPRGQKLMKEW